MTRHALKVVLVSEDRAVLSAAAQFLQKFGYQVRALIDAPAAQLTLAADRPEFLVLDGNLPEATRARLAESAAEQPEGTDIYTFLLIDEEDGACDLSAAVQTGIDDFLVKPLVHGELLARLRAGARVLEYRRRCARQSGVDPLTKLPGREALLARGEKRLPQSERAACAVLELDLFEAVRRVSGIPAGIVMVRTVAKTLRLLRPHEDALLAHFGGGRFAALWPDASIEDAEQWAGQLRQELAENDPHQGLTATSITLSAGVAGGETSAVDTASLLAQAEQALALAQRRGGDCVVDYTQCEKASDNWNQLAQPGQLFLRTQARHVMTPCTLLLRQDETCEEAQQRLSRTGSFAAPVVDADGKLAGVFTDGQSLDAVEHDNDPASAVQTAMDASVASFDETALFDQLLDHFIQAGQSLAVVVRGERPLGIVTRDSLAALVEPVSTETFAPGIPLTDTSDYLLVRDTAVI